jgi:hypothetical protein
MLCGHAAATGRNRELEGGNKGDVEEGKTQEKMDIDGGEARKESSLVLATA